jgi:hypothetical protein
MLGVSRDEQPALGPLANSVTNKEQDLPKHFYKHRKTWGVRGLACRPGNQQSPSFWDGTSSVTIILGRVSFLCVCVWAIKQMYKITIYIYGLARPFATAFMWHDLVSASYRENAKPERETKCQDRATERHITSIWANADSGGDPWLQLWKPGGDPWLQFSNIRKWSVYYVNCFPTFAPHTHNTRTLA